MSTLCYINIQVEIEIRARFAVLLPTSTRSASSDSTGPHSAATAATGVAARHLFIHVDREGCHVDTQLNAAALLSEG